MSRKIFLQQAGLTLGIRIAGLLFQVALFTLIARVSTLETVGQYAVINALWLLVRFLGPLGLDVAALRYLASLYETRQLDRVVGFCAYCMGKILTFSAWVVSLLIFFSLLISWLFPHYNMQTQVILLFALGFPAYAIMGLYVSQFRAAELVVEAQLPESLILTFFMCLGIFYLVFFGTIDIHGLLLVQAISVWLVVAIYIYRWRSRVRGVNRKPLSHEQKREIQNMAHSVLGGHVMTALSTRLPVILISVILGTAAAGLFEAGQRFGLLASLSTWAIGVVVSPMMARAHNKHDQKELQNLITLGNFFQTIPALLFFLFLLVFGELLLVLLLGDVFREAYYVMLLLALSILINAAGSIASTYLLMSGGEKTVFKFSAAKFLVVIIALPLAGWSMGLIGAGIAMVLSAIVRDVGMMIYIMMHHKFRPGIWSYQEFRRLVKLLPSMLNSIKTGSKNLH